MRICFSYQNLFPASSRSGRHIETLVHRFQEHGHEVTVITTPANEATQPDGLEMLRLRDAPGTKGRSRTDTLLGKAIGRFLKQNQVDVLFAEGLTPLTAVAVKAANREGVKTVIRALSDTRGIVHSIGGEKRLTPSALKKRLKTMLGYADAVAASSENCAALLGDFHDGEIQVINKCVDLSIFDPSRVREFEVSDLRDRLSLDKRPIILHARDELRADTVISTLGFMKSVAGIVPGVCMVVAGEIDEAERATEAIADAGLAENYRLVGHTEPRALFAAYSAASAFILPAPGRASETEILEAMAMGCPVVCLKGEGQAVLDVLDDGVNAAVLNVADDEPSGEAFVELMKDVDRRNVLAEAGRKTAETNDIHDAMNRVGHLCETLLGLPLTDYDQPLPRAEESAEEAEDAPDARELNNEDVSDSEALESEEREEFEDRQESEDDTSDEESEESSEAPARRRRRRRRRLGDGETAEGGIPDGDEESSQSDTDAESDDGQDEEEAPQPTEDELLADANKRLRELDPKLTLKELMPFLRPPRDLYILSIPAASGQHRAGDALLGAFKNIDQNLRISAINILELLGRGHSREGVMDVINNLSSDSALFGKVFENAEETEQVADEKEAGDDPFQKFFGPKLKKLIVDKTPDQVVLTHFLPLKAILALKEKHKLRMKVNVVITDYDLHPHWMAEGVDHYYVPSEKVRFKMMRAGISSNLIEVVGVPVNQVFEESVNRDRVRRKFNLKKGAPCILLRPGGIRSQDAVLETIEHLSNLPECSFNLLVLTGRDDALKESVEAIKSSRDIKVQATGFVDNIHELMGMADLLITRANGHTVAEACASGIPMLLLRPAAGLEERTADWFVERGVALKAHDAMDLEWLLSDLLRGGGRQLKKMGEAARNGAAGKSGAAGVFVERMARRLH